MPFATYSYGSTNQSPFNGNRPPYKIGDYFSFPDIVGRDAPGLTGTTAKPALIRSVSIAVGGYNTTAATSQFGVWDGSGANGAFSATFTLPNGGSSTPSKVSKTLTTSKQVYASTTYIIGFLKRNTSIVVWGIDNTKSGNVVEDNTNSGNSTAFEDDGTYNAGASLVWSFTYDILPAVPTNLTVTSSGTTANLSWTAPAVIAGETPVTGYRIQRSTDNSTWTTVVANTATTDVTYADTGRTNGVTYYYRVAGHNEVSTTFGTDYSGPYTDSVAVTVSAPVIGNATSTLVVSVNNPNPTPVVFADDGGGMPYESINIVYGSENLYNRVSAASIIDTAEIITVDATQSQDIYGVRGYDLGSDLLNDDLDGLAKAANNVLYKSYIPNLRVESISVRLNNLASNELASLLAVDIDTVVQVNFTPNGVGDQIQQLGRVIAVNHEVDIESHVVSYRLSSIDASPFVLDSPQWGQLDSNILG